MASDVTRWLNFLIDKVSMASFTIFMLTLKVEHGLLPTAMMGLIIYGVAFCFVLINEKVLEKVSKTAVVLYFNLKKLKTY